MAGNAEIKWRRDTAADWTSADPTLAEGEAGYETDTGKFKIGDGSTAWSSLSYFQTSGGGGGGLYSFVETVSVSGASSLDVDLGSSEEYLIVLDATPATNTVDLWARVTTDGFSTVESGSSDYSWNYTRQFDNSTSLGTTADSADSEITIGGPINNNSSDFIRTHVQVFNPSDGTRYTHIKHGGTTGSVVQRSVNGFGAYLSNSAVNGIRFLMESGNITATAHVYELVTS